MVRLSVEGGPTAAFFSLLRLPGGRFYGRLFFCLPSERGSGRLCDRLGKVPSPPFTLPYPHPPRRTAEPQGNTRMASERSEITMDQRLRFFALDDAHIRRFPRIAAALRRYVPAALNRLYDRIGANPALSSLFGGPSRIDHARNAQLAHWQQLFSGYPNQPYFDQATKIGRIHAEIGLEPTWYIGGYASVLEDMVVAMLAKAPPAILDRGASARAVATLVKVAMLDMDLALSAYFTAEKAERESVIVQLNETLRRIEAEERARLEAVVQIGSALAAVANNDFTVRLEGLPEGFAKIASDFELMRDNVSKTMTGVAHSVSGINTGASEIRAASDDLAMRTQQQAASLEETSARMEQITSGVENAARGAEEVTASVGEASREAGLGEDVARQAVGAMVAIQRSAQEISKIIELIDGIAFQTNLVALNAGVEAVRAGDAGKGFAVVANEVRALAQRSAEAAREIKDLVTGSVEEVDRGVELVGRSGDAFTRIAGRVGEIAVQASRISELSRAQSSSLQQVNLAVREMDQMTQHNAAMVEQTTAASRSLAGEAQELDAMVGCFQLDRATKSMAPIPARKQAARSGSRRLEGGRGSAVAAMSTEDWSEF